MMETLSLHLPKIWLSIIGFLLLYYVVTDGCDLGLGIISLCSGSDQDRKLLMDVISPVWHGNQTWLVVLGGMLFGAFPPFYSILLSALYLPMLGMIFGFILRGVAFEFRGHSRNKAWWILSFGMGSLISAIAQGFALGGLLGGLRVQNGQFAGGVWDWLNPYAALIAAGVVCGYVMLGAHYAILKTQGRIQQRSFRYAMAASICTLIATIAVHFCTALRYPHVARKWNPIPELSLMPLFAVLAAASFVAVFYSLRKRYESAPLIFNIAIIVFSFTGLSLGFYPDMVPGGLATPVKVMDAAASPKTLFFMLVVTGILLPVIVVYHSYTAAVFGGKTQEEYDENASHKNTQGLMDTLSRGSKGATKHPE